MALASIGGPKKLIGFHLPQSPALVKANAASGDSFPYQREEGVFFFLPYRSFLTAQRKSLQREE